MIYEVRLTVPANTPAGSAQRQEFNTHPGTVQQVELQFPAGCAGLVHARVLYDEHQVWPSQLDQDFSGDDTHLVFPEYMILGNSQNRFQLEAWNLDDTFSHLVIFRMAVLEIGATVQEAILAIGAVPGREG